MQQYAKYPLLITDSLNFNRRKDIKFKYLPEAVYFLNQL